MYPDDWRVLNLSRGEVRCADEWTRRLSIDSGFLESFYLIPVPSDKRVGEKG